VGANGYKRWDYIPGWGCWVSAKWTNDGCESKFVFTCVKGWGVCGFCEVFG
jgi:hypothetical protein